MKIKNIDHSKVVDFAALVNYQEGQVVSRTLTQNKAVSLTLFAFFKGEEISEHTSKGDALIFVFEGKAKITLDGKEYILGGGESILMPSEIPHAVFAEENFKMSLTVIF